MNENMVREALSEIEQTTDDDKALEMLSDLQFAVLKAIAEGKAENPQACATLAVNP